MASSTAASSPEVYMSAEELVEEIEYQRVLLQSLEGVADREQAEAEIATEIKSLEKRLKALRAGHHNPITSASGDMQSIFDDDPFGSFHTASNTRIGPTSSTSSTPNSAAAPSGLLSPLRTNLPTRKRSNGEQAGYTSPETVKFRRTSPRPNITRSTTPSTSSGDDDPITKELAKFRQRQRDAEERARRTVEDARIARKLQNEESGTLIPSSLNVTASQSAGNAGHTAFDAMMGRPQSSQSQSMSIGSREELRAPSLAQGYNQTLASSNDFNALGVQNVPNSTFPRYIMPGTYQESDSDSEIEIITPAAFNNNGRHTPFEGARRNLTLPAITSFSQPNSYNGATNHQASPAAEAARCAALQRMQFRQHADTISNPFTACKGTTLPQPLGMNSQTQGYSGYSPYAGAPGGYFHPSFSDVGMPPVPAGPSGIGSMSNDDSISRITQLTGYNFGSMFDIHGNLFDPRMANFNNSIKGRMEEVADYVQDPRRTAQEIQDLLENIRPDVEIPKENREGTPDGLKYALYEHQKLALTWLKQMEEGTNRGGILADDMGLGKTISALALILSRPSEDRRKKTTLIVGPVALVRQWEREIQTKIKRSHRLSTFLFHGQKKATWDTLRNFDIVLTTYGTLGAEYKRLEKWHEKCRGNPSLDRDSIQSKLPFLGKDSVWYRVILDEAQCIKNKATKAAHAACNLSAVTRFCLTGTPMMNGVHELYSLIHFLRIKPYNEYSKFTADFGCLSKSGGSRGYNHPQIAKHAMKRLQAVLKAILLRRTKNSKIDGKPILILPEKTEEIVHAIFNEDEQAYYTSLETKTRLQFNKYVKAGTIGKNYSNILVLLLRLRQAACHPHLIMDFEEAPPEATTEDMTMWAQSLSPDVVRRIVEATFPFECPVCYDPVPNPRIVIPCGHDTCSECLAKIAGNSDQEAIAEGHETGDAKCPTCRGRIDVKKIIDYETFKQVHMHNKEVAILDDELTESEDGECSIDDLSDTDDTDDSGSEDGRSDEDIRNFIVPDDFESSDETQDENDEEKDFAADKKTFPTGFGNSSIKTKEEGGVKNEIKDDEDDSDFVDIKDIKPARLGSRKDKKIKVPEKSQRPKQSKRKKKSKNKGKVKKAKESNNATPRHISLAVLKKEAMRSAEGRRRYMRYLRKNWVSSAKVDKCLEILRGTDPDLKTIIFSQFTTLLDLLEVPIKREKWGFMRYDGSMSAEKRHHAVVNFTDDPRCRVMLVSLKAGNAGLNLVAASQVVILDPFWNPFIEMQAVDRAHRIGQQRPVKVHRILVKETVEDRIIDLQDRKRKLVEAALDEKASQGLGRLGRQELIYLFNGSADRERAHQGTLR